MSSIEGRDTRDLARTAFFRFDGFLLGPLGDLLAATFGFFRLTDFLVFLDFPTVPTVFLVFLDFTRFLRAAIAISPLFTRQRYIETVFRLR